MPESGVCWGLLAALSALVVVLVRNTFLLGIVAQAAAKLLAAELKNVEAFKCRYGSAAAEPPRPDFPRESNSRPG